MKFYIFATNGKDKTFDIKGKNCILSDINYSKVRNYFDFINKEYRYRNSWLIADLDLAYIENKKPLKKAVLDNDNIIFGEWLPYFVVAEFHYDGDETCKYSDDVNLTFNPRLTIRKDTTYIKCSGFTQRFNNNDAAISQYINYVECGNRVQFWLRARVEGFLKSDTIIERLIGVSAITNEYYDDISFSKITIPNPITYLAAPFARPKLNNYDLRVDGPEEKSDKDEKEIDVMLTA